MVKLFRLVLNLRSFCLRINRDYRPAPLLVLVVGGLESKNMSRL